MNILVWLAVPAAILAAAALVVWKLLRSRNMEIWIGSYLRRPRVPASTLLACVRGVIRAMSSCFR